MCFKKKVEKKLDIYDDRSIILLSSQELDVLIVLIQENQIRDLIKSIQEELKYLSPRNNLEVIKIDQKIRSKIGDIKISITGLIKASNEDVIRQLNEIKVLIKEREAKEIK